MPAIDVSNGFDLDDLVYEFWDYEPIVQLHRRGWLVIPQDSDRRPKVRFKDRQGKPWTDEELAAHFRKFAGLDGLTYGLIAGQRSVVVLDFDGDAGRKLYEQWKLRANVSTRSGGFHVWVSGVGFPVKSGRSDTRKGLEFKGENGTATFWGKTPKGNYEVLDTKPTRFSALPDELQKEIRQRTKFELRTDGRVESDPSDADSPASIAATCLSGALFAIEEGREGYIDRNESGFSFFCQLRDNRVPESIARAYIDIWVSQVNLAIAKDEPYQREEAERSLRQAYDGERRDPSLARVLTRHRGLIRLSDVDSEPVKWLWKGYIPLGKLTVLDGDPEKGKSSVTTDIAASYSAGESMPDGKNAGQGNVLFISSEDSVADTIKPRFEAAGGDSNRASYYPLPINEKTGRVRPLSIPEDLDEFEDRIRDNDISLVIIDPITAVLSETISTNNDASVRSALTPLKEVAETLGCAFILVRHLNKDSGETLAIYRGGGSIAFAGQARAVWVVGDHPHEEGVRVLAQVKMNLGGLSPSLKYRIEPSSEDPEVSVVNWLGKCDIRANDLFGKKDFREVSEEREEARTFLETVLADGPKYAKEMRDQARHAGIAKRTLDRAKKDLGVRTWEAERNEDGTINGWVWALPGTVIKKGEVVM